MVHRIFPLENINHKHAFSSYINHCLPVFCQIADNIFSACRKSYSKYLLFKKIRVIHEYILPNIFCFFFTAMHFSICFFSFAYNLFRYFIPFGFYFFLPGARLISLRSILAFVVKRNWYFMAKLIWLKGKRGKNGMKHTIFKVYGACIC